MSADAAAFAIVGAGGLGGPVAYALAAAGARRLLLCDHDAVELSNLQRQIQFGGGDLGRPKVDALADELVRRGYPAARIEPVRARFDRASADRVLAGADVAIEATDDPATKFAFNDEAVARRIPFAIGGVDRYGGQVLAARAGASGCYRCLFEEPPGPGEAQSCAEQGVLGAVVAVIGGLLARAALALAAGAPGAAGELLVVDHVAAGSWPRRVRYNPRPECPACQA